MSKAWSKQSYISKFLSLKSAGDILNIVNPIAHCAKEITESMGVIKRLRNIALKEPMKYTLYDLCAGNALTSVIAAHLLPVKNVIALDIRPRKRRWEDCKRFEYIFSDIYKLSPDFFAEDSIIIGVHSCKNLAKKIIELYNQSQAKHLVLMPCCEGSLSDQYQLVCNEMGKQFTWCLELQVACNGRMYKDQKVISPKNYIIVANKNKKEGCV